jgi:hypothetical protein
MRAFYSYYVYICCVGYSLSAARNPFLKEPSPSHPPHQQSLAQNIMTIARNLEECVTALRAMIKVVE